MKGIEQAAFASGQSSGEHLMEMAGAAAAKIIRTHAPQADTPPRTVILCGPGGNGGDGYVVARHLAALGWPVEVRALAPPRHTAARKMCRRWTGPTAPFDAPIHADLIVDALFGIGTARMTGIPPLPEDIFRIAIDLPSGLDPDTGRAADGTLRADLTIALHAAKTGHYLADGPAMCGTLHVVPLDLPLPPEALRLARPRPDLLAKANGHKYDHGHAAILCGPSGKGGAARMAARAALRVGAGLVTLAPPPTALAENAARLDAIMLHPVDSATDLTAWLADRRINALCLGPALGAARAAALVPAALAARRATVLDADALTWIATSGHNLHDRCVLTPHEGEFARLFPDLAHTADPRPKPDRVRDAAARAGCTVLLKGHDTVIATPDGHAVLAHAGYDRAAPWLATAGAGDVLAGLIAGLLARGLPPPDAAEQAAWLHVDAARRFGPGLTAEDLPDLIPRTLAALGV